MPTLAPFDIETHALFGGFINDIPVFIGADGIVHLLADSTKAIEANDGIASIAADIDNLSLITGGEDGRVCRIHATGEVNELAKIGNKWITAIASGPNHAFAFATGKTVQVNAGKDSQQFNLERSIEALTFAPKGLRIALAHYNGVTLYWPGTQSEPVCLEWKGAHTNVTFSPDGRFLITAMQENALHGWRLGDSQHLRMSGYPTKVKSWSWSVKGRYLATSGAMAAILWPFISKDGPMGKAPLELGTRADVLVTSVCCHPQEEMVAIGYNDGMILFVRFADQKEILLRRPGKGAITSLNWDQDGYRLAFASEQGECGIINISAG